MNKIMKISFITVLLVTGIVSIAYAAQPETPNLYELIQNIFNQLLGIETKIDNLDLSGPDITALESNASDIHDHVDEIEPLLTNPEYGLEALAQEIQELNNRITQLEQILNTEPPVADPNGPYTELATYPVQFDGYGSYDPDGTIVLYSWKFGDGNNGQNVFPQHTYASEGIYTVELTVTDDDGATHTATTIAEIGPAPIGIPPVSDPSGTYYAGPLPSDFNVTLDGSGSYDPDGTIVSYEWTVWYPGDFTWYLTGVTPTYQFPQSYDWMLIELTVTDNDGNTHTTQTGIEFTYE
jgi:PKD repeat protein